MIQKLKGKIKDFLLGAVSFFLWPWAYSNAKTDGDGLNMNESVLLVYSLIIVLSLSLILKSVLKNKEEGDV